MWPIHIYFGDIPEMTQRL